MELYLIRHGQSTNNRGDPRVSDPPLTEFGEEQARLVGQFIKDKGISRLYCSPMIRALHTAALINEHLGLVPHVFVGLHEMGGIYEDRKDGRVQLPGLNRAGMMAVCPNVVVPDDVTDEGWWFYEWETFEDVAQLAYDNGLAFIEYLKANYADTDERVAAVSHGGSGSKFLEALFAIPDTSYTRFAHHNTAVSKIIITTDQVRLRYLNRIDHLPEELVT